MIVVLVVRAALRGERESRGGAGGGAAHVHLDRRQPDRLRKRRGGGDGVPPGGVGERAHQPRQPSRGVRHGSARPAGGPGPLRHPRVSGETPPAERELPGLVPARARPAVGHVHVPGPAEVHAHREPQGLRDDGDPGGVESAVGDRGHGVQHLEHAPGPVPPVGDALVDRPVGGQLRDVAVEAVEGTREETGDPVGVVEQQHGGQEHVAEDPGIPVVDVAPVAEPPQVVPGLERGEHARLGLVPDALAQAWPAHVPARAEDPIRHGQLRDDLARDEIEIRGGHIGHHEPAPGMRVVVRGQRPGALLAQHHDAVRRLVDPPRFVGHGRGHHSAAQPLLPSGHRALVGRPVAVADVAGELRAEDAGPGAVAVLLGGLQDPFDRDRIRLHPDVAALDRRDPHPFAQRRGGGAPERREQPLLAHRRTPLRVQRAAEFRGAHGCSGRRHGVRADPREGVRIGVPRHGSTFACACICSTLNVWFRLERVRVSTEFSDDAMPCLVGI